MDNKSAGYLAISWQPRLEYIGALWGSLYRGFAWVSWMYLKGVCSLCSSLCPMKSLATRTAAKLLLTHR